MGWSCSVKAGTILRRMAEACFNNSGNQSLWKESGKSYFFETSRREYNDGAITGRVYFVYKATDPKDGQIKDFCRPAGSLRINGDGTVQRAPKFLKDAALMETPEEIQDKKLRAEFDKGHMFVVL